jgi:hypothetical protein
VPAGLLAITLFHLVQTLSDVAGWLVLIPKQNRVRLTSSFFLHWLGESINNLLPTGRVGGDIVVARVAAMWGMPLRIATAAMVVDITIGVITKVIFIVVSSILLVAATGRTDIAYPALVTVLIGLLAVAGFYTVQRIGVFRWSATLAISSLGICSVSPVKSRWRCHSFGACGNLLWGYLGSLLGISLRRTVSGEVAELK